MIKFNYMQEVEEWLAPLTYEEFWRETDPNGLQSEDRDHYDCEIARGIPKATILTVLKGEKRLEIIAEQDLKCRHPHDEMLLH
ncbi:hypothetical protein [Pararhizobium sp. IMCC21322]|uniref:hypothetical protein n=1 Tax=Pararhizobium sp. IMCC21322 TaxID=3067903 RepID=UPI0027414709|nr:hypothetical protein [Pararhizobium sp. IMCC21322]